MGPPYRSPQPRLARGGVSDLCVRFALDSFRVLAAVLFVSLAIGPRTGWYRTLTLLSGSMRPAYSVGSVVIDVPERPSELRVGQVITYEIPVADHRVVSHRVVKVLSGGTHPTFQTKGDANPVPDPWTAQVTGPTVWRVRAVVPGLGWLILGLREPLVRRMLVLGVPAVLVVLGLVEIWREPGVKEGVRRHGEAHAQA